MSVPYSIVSCSACDLRGSTLQLAGLFRWRDEAGRSHLMDRELGVCPDCAAIVAMEVLPAEGDVEAARRKAEASPPQEARPRSRWTRVLAVFGAAPRPSGKVREREAPEVLDAVRRLGRRPACLDCGSRRVTAIPWPKGISSRDDTLRPLGTTHPGCGGALLVQGSGGWRIAPVLKERSYDIHGHLIETVPR